MNFRQLAHFSGLMLVRNWRMGGLNTILLLIILVIALISSLSWYSDRMQKGINARAAELFGGDLIIKSPRPLPSLWEQQAVNMGLKTTKVVYINTLAASKLPEPHFANIQVKAVDNNYPLYGKLKVSAANDTNKTENTQAKPTPGTVWLEPRVAYELKIAPGSTIEIGAARFVFERFLYEIPDGQADQFKIAPTVFMSLDDLEKTQILGPRSRADYLLMIGGPINDFTAWVKPKLERGQNATTALEGRLEVKAGFSQAMNYLKIGIFLILLLAGSVMNVGLKEYNRKNDISIGVLRCLGMPQSQVIQVLLLQFLMLIILAGLIALPLGFAMHYLWHLALGEMLPTGLANELGSINGWIGIQALLFCGLFLFVFGIQHWLGLGRIPPLRVLRHEQAPPSVTHRLFFAVKAATIFALLYFYLNDLRLVLFGLTFLTVVVALIRFFCFILGKFLRKVAHKLPVVPNIAALNIARYMPQRYIEIIVFTLISFAICFSFLLYDSLLNSWQKQIAPNTADYFIFNIAPETLQPLNRFLEEQKIHIAHVYPILRGRLTELNGTQLTKKEGGESIHNNALTRELNITATNQLPQDNEIIAGKWWTPAEEMVPQASVEEGLAKNFSIKVGDVLSFRLADQIVSVPVTSVRKVAWANQQPNFYIIFPKSMIANYSITYLIGIRLLPQQEPIIDNLRQKFPALSILSIALIIDQAKHFFQQLSVLVVWILCFVLIVGIISQNLVLWATRKEREVETAILKVFGISLGRLLGIWLWEYGFYAVLSSFLGISLAYFLQKFILLFYLNINPIVHLSTIFITIGINGTIILLATAVNVKKNMEVTPISLIR